MLFRSLILVQRTDVNNLVVRSGSRFYVTRNGGVSWTRVLGPDAQDANTPFSAIAFSDAKRGIAALSNGSIRTTADGGLHWTGTALPVLNRNAPVALRVNSATDAWLLLDGRLRRSTDGGATWSTPPVDATMTGLIGMSWSDAAHGWAYNNASLFTTDDGGAHWARVPLPAAGLSLATRTGPSGGVISSLTGSFYTPDSGGSWKPSVMTPLAGTGVAYYRGSSLWWWGGLGLYRSRDAGATWPDAPIPVFGAFTGLAFANEDHGWLVGNQGELRYSADGGTTWTPQYIGADVTLTSVFAFDSKTAWAVTRNGEIIATATGGF